MRKVEFCFTAGNYQGKEHRFSYYKLERLESAYLGEIAQERLIFVSQLQVASETHF